MKTLPQTIVVAVVLLKSTLQQISYAPNIIPILVNICPRTIHITVIVFSPFFIFALGV